MSSSRLASNGRPGRVGIADSTSNENSALPAPKSWEGALSYSAETMVGYGFG